MFGRTRAISACGTSYTPTCWTHAGVHFENFRKTCVSLPVYAFRVEQNFRPAWVSRTSCSNRCAIEILIFLNKLITSRVISFCLICVFPTMTYLWTFLNFGSRRLLFNIIETSILCIGIRCSRFYYSNSWPASLSTLVMRNK